MKKDQSKWLKMAKGLLMAMIISILGMFALAFVVKTLHVSDGVILTVNQIIKLISILIGTFLAVGRGGEKGLLRGGALGILYMGIGLAAYTLIGQEPTPLPLVASDLLMGLVSGGICGAIAANMK